MFNLSGPATVNEYDGGFSAMVSMIELPDTNSTIEIDIMDRGVTATPNGNYYASVGGATRYTVVVVSVSQSFSQSVATISRSSLKTNR